MESSTCLFCLSPLHSLTQCGLNLNLELLPSHPSKKRSSSCYAWVWRTSQVLSVGTLVSPALHSRLSDPSLQPGPRLAFQKPRPWAFCGHRRRSHLLSASPSPHSGAGPSPFSAVLSQCKLLHRFSSFSTFWKGSPSNISSLSLVVFVDLCPSYCFTVISVVFSRRERR